MDPVLPGSSTVLKPATKQDGATRRRPRIMRRNKYVDTRTTGSIQKNFAKLRLIPRGANAAFGTALSFVTRYCQNPYNLLYSGNLTVSHESDDPAYRVVHPFCALLAAGIAGVGTISNRLAGVVALASDRHHSFSLFRHHPCNPILASPSPGWRQVTN